MPPRGVRPRGLRELTFLARTASALGFFLLSTTPLAIQSQLAANAETGPAIDPIQTAALAVEIVPESVSRDANADLPMVEAYRAAPAVVPADLGAFLLAIGNRPRPAAHSSPANSMMAAALAVRPHTIGSRPAPAEDPPASAFDPNAPIAYADPARIEDFEAPFRALIDAPAKPEMDIHQPDPAADHDWVTNPIPRRAKSVAEKRCLAEAIYFEARSEPIRGQLAVAQVVVNRLKNPAYPGTIYGVVYQNRQYRNACQFSFACDGVRDVIRDHPAWETAQELARAVLDGEAIWLEEIGSATHYHANYV